MNKYIQIIVSQPKPLRFLMSRLLWKTGLCHFYQIKQNGFNLHFYPSSFSASLWVSPEDRCSDESFFRHYLKRGDKVIDVGANIGNLTAVASLSIGEEGKVYSIEAHPRIYNYLLGNIKLNNFLNIKAFNYAVGNFSERKYFSNENTDDQNVVMQENKGIIVQMKKLDELPINDKEIHLLKIDVEGYEKFVIEGGNRILQHTKCLYFESYEKHFNQFNYSTTDLIKLLASQGFVCYKIDEEDFINRVPENYISETCENLIGIKNLEEFMTRTNFKYKEMP